MYHRQCLRFLNAIIFFRLLHSRGDDLRPRLPEGSDLWPRLPKGSEKLIV